MFKNMFKSIQIKIILILIITSLIIILGTGTFYISNLEKTKELVQGEEAREEIELQTKDAKTVLIVTSVAFGIIGTIVLIFSAKAITNPIAKLISSAKQLSEGEETEVELKILEKDKPKTEIDELVKTFSAMTEGLKENLNEVTRQKNQIETILLHMTDGIVAFNMDGGIIHINPAASRLLQIVSQNETFDTVFKKINININMEKIIYLEDWASSEQKVNIGGYYINLFFVPFKDENNRPAGVVVVAQDITEHVKLDNMRKEFVADVSHELKTPLTSIMGYAETLLASEYDKELQEKFLNVIISETVRMTKLVTDLLSLSKFDTNKANWERTEFDLGELVKKCQENLQIEMDKKNQKVECFVTANVPKVYADKDEIERVILNVLSNSVKYTNEGGSIKIYVGFVYNDAYIKVIDNGIGIPEKDLGRIFERFYRVDKARTRSMGGTGLRTFYSKRNPR